MVKIDFFAKPNSGKNLNKMEKLIKRNKIKNNFAESLEITQIEQNTILLGA